MNEKQLRDAIDSSRTNPTDVSKQRTQLAIRYILSPEEHGFTFSIEELKNYLDDWYHREISTAFEFIQLAIDHHFEAFDKIFMGHDASKGEKSQPIHDYYVQKQIERQNEYASHYFDLDDDKNKFIFHINNLASYLKDWLDGINAAEDFLILALKQDIHQFISTIDQLPIKQSKSLLDLVIKHLETDDVSLLSAIHYKQAIANATDPEKMINLLAEVLEASVIREVFSQNRGLLQHALGVLQATPQVNDFLVDFCVQVLELGQEQAASNLFLIAISGVNDSVILSSFLKRMRSIATDSRSLNIQSHQNISGEYFIYSIYRNEATLLEVCLKNPQQFIKLFCHELDFFRENASSHRVKAREAFYLRVIQHQKMLSSSVYETCLLKINETFKAALLPAKLILTRDGEKWYLNFSSQAEATQYHNLCKQLLPPSLNKEFEKSKESSDENRHFRFRLTTAQYESISPLLHLPAIADEPKLTEQVKSLLKNNDIDGLKSFFLEYPALKRFQAVLKLLPDMIEGKTPDAIRLLLEPFDLKEIFEAHTFNDYAQNLRKTPRDSLEKDYYRDMISMVVLNKSKVTPIESEYIMGRKIWSDVVSETYQHNQKHSREARKTAIDRLRAYDANPEQLLEKIISYLQDQTVITVTFIVHLPELTDHQVLNVWERKNKSDNYMVTRKKCEDGMFAFLPSQLKDSLSANDHAKPRYGALQLTDRNNLPTCTRMYGSSYLILKDAVKYNCLFVPGDSFRGYQPCTIHNPEFLLSQCETGTLNAIVSRVKQGVLPYDYVQGFWRPTTGGYLEAFIPGFSVFDPNFVEHIHITGYITSHAEKEAKEAFTKRGITITSQTSVPYSDLLKQFKDAIEKNEVATVNTLLTNHTTLTKDLQQDSAIHLAVKANAIDVLKILITKTAKMTQQSIFSFINTLYNGYSPLHVAVAYKNLPIARLLIETYQVNINAKINDPNSFDNGATAFYLAYKQLSSDIVQYFIQHEADAHLPTAQNDTVWHLAVRRKDSAMIKQLLAYCNPQNDTTRKVLKEAVEIARHNNYPEITCNITMALLLSYIKINQKPTHELIQTFSIYSSQNTKVNSLVAAIVLHEVASKNIAQECLKDEEIRGSLQQNPELQEYFNDLGFKN